MAGRCNTCGAFNDPRELVAWLCANGLCPAGGLACSGDGSCLFVQLEPGGGLAIGPTGGLQVTSCCEQGDPIPGQCVETVGALGEFVVGGRGGGASLLHPYGSPQGIQYALAHHLDMIVTDTWSSEDEIALWSVYGPTTPLDVFTTSPTTAAAGGVMSSDWISLRVDAGTGVSPTGRNAYAPAEFLDPDGGWYGWYAPAYQPQTLQGVAQSLNQRSVIWADIANTADPAVAARHVAAAIQAVGGACTAASTILAVNVEMGSYVDLILNAGIEAAVYVDAGQTSVTPDQVTATGAQWVRLSGAWDDEQIAPYVAAGLQVILVTNSRHWSTERAQSLGVRGVHANDPVYARYPIDPAAFGYYKRTRASYARRQTELGHLTTQTDTLGVIDARGFTKSTEFGLFTWVTEDRPRNSILIGEVCPLESPDDDSYPFEVQVDAPGGPLPTGESPKIGVTICSTTDRDTAVEEGDGDGYAAFIRVGTESTGVLEIGKLTPGEPYETLATSAGMAVPPNDWMQLRVDVTPTSVTLTRTDTGTPYSVTVTDTDYRGPYVHWLANKVPGNPSGDFVAGMRQFIESSTDPAVEAGSATLAVEPAAPRRLLDVMDTI